MKTVLKFLVVSMLVSACGRAPISTNQALVDSCNSAGVAFIKLNQEPYNTFLPYNSNGVFVADGWTASVAADGCNQIQNGTLTFGDTTVEIVNSEIVN